MADLLKVWAEAAQIEYIEMQLVIHGMIMQVEYTEEAGGGLFFAHG